MKTQINEQTQWQTQIESNIQVRIVARKKRILDDDVVITQDNIQRIGEIIAVTVIKTVMCRSDKNLYWLYGGLIKDCKRRSDVNHTYSDGYDIVYDDKIKIYYKYTNNRPDDSQDERRGCFYSECTIKINKAKRSMQILHIRIDRTIHFQLPYTINRRHKITFDLDAPSR